MVDERLIESGFGLEIIETEAIKILAENINQELIEVEERWKERDLETNQALGILPITIELEHFKEGNYHMGHTPSLIEAPIDKYPNICSIASESAASESDYDQFNNYDISLAIEFIVKSLYNESEVNRRAQRTLEAVHNVMMRNQTLNGLIEGFDNDPSGVLTGVFTRSDHPQGSNNEWYWRLGRIDYMITRQAKVPEN